LLLIVELDHLPTSTEPQSLDQTILDHFRPELAAVRVDTYGVRADHNVYGSILGRIGHTPGLEGILCARLERVSRTP
jgi:hypothetical protein